MSVFVLLGPRMDIQNGDARMEEGRGIRIGRCCCKFITYKLCMCEYMCVHVYLYTCTYKCIYIHIFCAPCAEREMKGGPVTRTQEPAGRGYYYQRATGDKLRSKRISYSNELKPRLITSKKTCIRQGVLTSWRKL